MFNGNNMKKVVLFLSTCCFVLGLYFLSEYKSIDKITYQKSIQRKTAYVEFKHLRTFGATYNYFDFKLKEPQYHLQEFHKLGRSKDGEIIDVTPESLILIGIFLNFQLTIDPKFLK